jgi:tetratricopeptide (TPR) repeat protein
MAAEEFARAEELRLAAPKAVPPDPAVLFLRGLLLVREGRRSQALSLLEEAAALEPGYPLFRFKLAENRYLLSGDPRDPKLRKDLDAALALSPEDGWVANLAAQVALNRGDLEEAGGYLEKALRFLGDVPAIRVNRGVLYYLRGSLDEALKTLTAAPAEDPEGIMTNCAGNLLVREGRYDEADEYYVKALSIAPDNIEYLCNRASCLIELGRYGEADETLAQAHSRDSNTAVLELIAYVAIKKGEYPRAENACRTALDLDPRHVPSLLSLGWIYASSGRWDALGAIISRLEKLPLEGDAAVRREELKTRLESAQTKVISCAACGRTWRVLRSQPPVKPIRLFAMPPGELPAGACPQCGQTYCIACAKEHLDPQGRFLCVQCGASLKLTDEGLKKLVYDWAASAIPGDV